MLLLTLAFLYLLGADGDCGLLSLHPAPLLVAIKMHSLFFVSLSGCFMSPTLFPVFQTLFFNGFSIACFKLSCIQDHPWFWDGLEISRTPVVS